MKVTSVQDMKKLMGAFCQQSHLLLLCVLMLTLMSNGKVQGQPMDLYGNARAQRDMGLMRERFYKRGIWDGMKTCLWQGDYCHPWFTRCCPGMSCRNVVGGYCMAGIEKCVCLPDNPHDNFY